MPYEGSRENARTLADMIHKIAQIFGVEPFLKSVVTDTPSVTIAALQIYNRWRADQHLPAVSHGLCVIHRMNLVGRAFDEKLSTTCDVWQRATALAKVFRGAHVVAALEAMGAGKTKVDLGTDVRWHSRIDSAEELLQVIPDVARISVEGDEAIKSELGGKLMRLGIGSADDLLAYGDVLRPIVDFCVNTFRLPIKLFEARDLINAAPAVWHAFRTMELALQSGRANASIADACCAGLAKLDQIHHRLGQANEKTELADALFSPFSVPFLDDFMPPSDQEGAKEALIGQLDELVGGCGFPVPTRVWRSAARFNPTALLSQNWGQAMLATPTIGSPTRTLPRASEGPRWWRDDALQPLPGWPSATQLLAQPHGVVSLDDRIRVDSAGNRVTGLVEVTSYIEGRQRAEGARGMADGFGVAVDEVNPGDHLAFWLREFARARAEGHMGRLQYLGIVASAKPVANAAIESSFSHAKHISADARQRMSHDSLQYCLICVENVELGEPILKTLIKRWMMARRTHSKAFLAPPTFGKGCEPADGFVWEDRATFVQPLGRRENDGEWTAKYAGTTTVTDIAGWMAEL
jgi:hypothetical protein